MTRETMRMLIQHRGWVYQAGLALLLGIITLPGCSTKSALSTTSGSEAAKAAPAPAPAQTHMAEANKSAEGQSNAPLDSGRPNDEPMKGLSKMPTEERIVPPAPMVVAKAEQPDAHAGMAHESAGRQLADIYFAFDKWTLSEEGKKNLAESAGYLKQHPDAKLAIEGYCDERGSREYNLVLGEKRAKESLRYLTALGIKNPASITSYGKERPVCTESNESCYWKNRRGHLVVTEGR